MTTQTGLLEWQTALVLLAPFALAGLYPRGGRKTRARASALSGGLTPSRKASATQSTRTHSGSTVPLSEPSTGLGSVT